MAYTPHTQADVREMLDVIGVQTIDDLFHEIPSHLRLSPGSLNLPSRMSEDRLIGHLQYLSEKNVDLTRTDCYLGAGIYDRFIPATVGAVISRGEFLTAYTPYQPEASQGYLQTIYEFQSMIAELFGMDLANASMYDGGTGMAEAAIMTCGIKNRTKVAVSRAIHPHYRQILNTYFWAIDHEVVEIADSDGVTTDYSALDDSVAAVIVGYPNFFGLIEDLAVAKKAADKVGALLVVVADPVACALLKPPGEFGADIVVGEGQSLGVAMGLGGPGVGLFACKEEYIRRIPGRIVGKTKEVDGDRSGFVMTLRTREQDIRREKATSNICTNEALMALANTVYLTSLGKNGLKQVAEVSARNAHYAAQQLEAAGAKLKYSSRYFDEFVLELPVDAEKTRDVLLNQKILAGLPLSSVGLGGANELLVAVTEKRDKAAIDRFAHELKTLIASGVKS